MRAHVIMSFISVMKREKFVKNAFVENLIAWLMNQSSEPKDRKKRSYVYLTENNISITITREHR